MSEYAIFEDLLDGLLVPEDDRRSTGRSRRGRGQGAPRSDAVHAPRSGGRSRRRKRRGGQDGGGRDTSGGPAAQPKDG